MNILGQLGLKRLAVPVVWVTTKDDRSIRGVLVDRTRDVMVLRAAQISALTEGSGTKQETWTRMTGDVVIPWDNVSFWQEGIDPTILE